MPEIIRRGTLAIQSDWAADPDFAYIERDEVQKNGTLTSRSNQVVEVEGSDYQLPIAIANRPLPPDRQNMELQKFRNEVERRKTEDPEARQRRIAKYQKKRSENGALLLDFPSAFNFELVGEETMNGHPAYVLSATPKQRTGPLSLASRVLAGMRGTLWLDKENYHAIRVECDAVKPVPVFGILARVLPGTHIELEMAPAGDSVWLMSRISMALTLSKLGFKSSEITHSMYSDYRPNSMVVDDLLAQAGKQ